MRLLVIEDEERLAKALKKGLEKDGFAVDHFGDGENAVKHVLVHHNSYDGIVLDLMLPGVDGTEICRILRERGIKTPILILTAREQTVDKVMLLNLGADDYMTKPFSLAELSARLRAIMRRPDIALPAELQAGPLRLSPGFHKVFLDESEISLTTKEFSLLEFFMRHPDQVLDREHILEHVWDFNFNSFSNVVDVHVKNLRKKLGQEDGRIFIETVSGVGYRFISPV